MSFKYAHAKGVIMYDSSSAVYIIHSIPKFPSFTSTGLMNTTISERQLIYGQNMMCISLSSSEMFQVAGLVSLIQPLVYHTHIAIENSNITNIANHDILNDYSTKAHSFSSNGLKWVYLSKSQYAGVQVWDHVVTEHFSSGLQVQSWGRPYMDSVCPRKSKYSVLNVAVMKILGVSWKGGSDHSKWAVNDKMGVVCYGDMNRMTSQATRGGGSMCVYSKDLYDIHKKIIQGVRPCS